MPSARAAGRSPQRIFVHAKARSTPQVEKDEDRCRLAISQLKRACRDASPTLQLAAHGALFRLLDGFIAAGSAFAPRVYKVIHSLCSPSSFQWRGVRSGVFLLSDCVGLLLPTRPPRLRWFPNRSHVLTFPSLDCIFLMGCDYEHTNRATHQYQNLSLAGTPLLLLRALLAARPPRLGR